MAINALLTLLLLLATLLPLLRCSHWVVRGLDFPRVQFAVFAAALLIAHCLFLDLRQPASQALVATTVACLAWQLFWILPYTFIWRREVKGSDDSDARRQLSILTSNVLMSNRNADLLIRQVERLRPDVLVTMESDHWWEDRLRVLEREMHHCVKCPLDNLYGMHVYSRLPLGEAEIRFIVEEDVPSIHATITLRTGDEVRVHFLHPAPPSPTENPESSERDAELIVVARSVAGADQPVVVAGDLNDVAWSATTRLFRKISGLLDPRVGRGVFNTFHARYPFVRWPLDHLFHSNHFTLLDIERLPSIGSDHFPMLTRLAFTPARGSRQGGLEASKSEQEWADDITAEQNVSQDDVPEPGAGST